MIIKSKYSRMLIILLVGMMLLVSLTYADSQDILARIFNVKFVIDGSEKQGSDKPFLFKNGEFYTPTAIIYQGTTYVPIRFVSEALGKPVKYDGVNNTIFIGQLNQGQYMSDIMQPFYNSTAFITSFKANQTMKMGGKDYYKGYRIADIYDKPSTISFNLEGKYTNITGVIGLEDNKNNYDTVVQLWGDDNLLATYTFKAGGLSQNLNLNVTGVIKLDIKATNTGTYATRVTTVNLADLIIK